MLLLLLLLASDSIAQLTKTNGSSLVPKTSSSFDSSALHGHNSTLAFPYPNPSTGFSTGTTSSYWTYFETVLGNPMSNCVVTTHLTSTAYYYPSSWDTVATPCTTTFTRTGYLELGEETYSEAGGITTVYLSYPGLPQFPPLKPGQCAVGTYRTYTDSSWGGPFSVSEVSLGCDLTATLYNGYSASELSEESNHLAGPWPSVTYLSPDQCPGRAVASGTTMTSLTITTPASRISPSTSAAPASTPSTRTTAIATMASMTPTSLTPALASASTPVSPSSSHLHSSTSIIAGEASKADCKNWLALLLSFAAGVAAFAA